jgi:hypothetical protein
MADLNRQLINVTQKTSRLKDDLIGLLREYEGLFHEANGIYMTERLSSDNTGLEDFYMLLQTIRRNRDLIGSVLKGLSSIRPTDKFRFIEEDVSKPKPAPKKERKMKGYIEVPPVMVEEAPVVDIQEVREESVGVTNG